MLENRLNHDTVDRSVSEWYCVAVADKLNERTRVDVEGDEVDPWGAVQRFEP